MLPETASPSTLKNPAFRRLCGALFAAMTVLVEEVTHSSAQMGLMIFASTLPGLLFGLLAGVVVDRHERVGVLVTSNALRVLVSLGFLAVVRLLRPPVLLPAIYLSNFALAALAQFVAAAEGATIPRLVGSKQLLAANSLFNLALLASQGAGLVGLAPLLLKLGDPQAVALVAILLNLAAVALSDSLPREEMAPQARERQTLSGLWADFKAGWRFIASDRPVSLATVQLVLASSVSLLLSTLAPGFVARGLGLRVEDAAYMAVPVGVGLALGLALVGRQGNRRRKESWVNIGLLVLGGALAFLPALRRLEGLWWLLFLLVTLGMGFGFSLILTPARAVLQERPSERMRGRVIAAQMTLSNAASTLPLPLAGGLADLIGIRRVLFLVALVVLGAAAASSRYKQA
jgi:MFS family permease